MPRKKFFDTHQFDKWLEEERKKEAENVAICDPEKLDPLATTELSVEDHNAAIIKAVSEARVDPERLIDGHSSRAAAGSNATDIYRRCKSIEEERTRDFARLNEEERKFKRKFRELQEENVMIEEKRLKKMMKRKRKKQKIESRSQKKPKLSETATTESSSTNTISDENFNVEEKSECGKNIFHPSVAVEKAEATNEKDEMIDKSMVEAPAESTFGICTYGITSYKVESDFEKQPEKMEEKERKYKWKSKKKEKKKDVLGKLNSLLSKLS